MEKVAGVVEVWRTDDTHEIVIKHPDLKPDAKGVSQIVFSPRHARHLASLLIEHAADAEAEAAGKSLDEGISGGELQPGRLVDHSVFRIVEVLREIPTGLRIEDLRAMTGFPRSTISRALTNLVACKCASRSDEGSYRLNNDVTIVAGEQPPGGTADALA
jgi:hypothetical protein